MKEQRLIRASIFPGACGSPHCTASSRPRQQSRCKATAAWRGILALSILWLPFAVPALAAWNRSEIAADAFNAANRMYEQGKYRDAAANYEKLVQSGVNSPAVYFNAGNAWLKSGQIGRAIAAYRQAQQLAPRDPDVAVNLDVARNKVSNPLPKGLRRSWVNTLTLNEWTALAAGLIWLWFVLLIVRQLRPGPKNRWHWSSIALFVVCAGAAACAGSVARDRIAVEYAVVIAAEAVARLGPFEESQSSFTLTDGTEVNILDHHTEWVQVRDVSHRIGWIRDGQILSLKQNFKTPK